jgi:hypothetical protein
LAFVLIVPGESERGLDKAEARMANVGVSIPAGDFESWQRRTIGGKAVPYRINMTSGGWVASTVLVELVALVIEL